MTLSVTHSKTLVSPDSGGEDKVYGTDYVSATSHSLSGLTAGQILYPSSATALTDSANLTWGTAAGQGLFLGAGTATTDVQALSATQTWNNAAVSFTGLKFTITDTASAAGSLALQILGGAAGATNLFAIDKAGNVGIGTTGPATKLETLVASGNNTLQITTTGGSSFIPKLALNRGGDTSWNLSHVSGTFDFTIDQDNNRKVTIRASTGNLGIGTTSPQSLLSLPTTGVLSWEVSAGSIDSSLSRVSAGLIALGTGAAGSFAGRLKLTSAIAAGVTVANLNAAPTTGEIQSVTDALTPAAGSAVAAGGAAKALVWWNGAAWNVFAV